MHMRIKRRRIPVHTEYLHSGGATTLSFIVHEANTVNPFVMRSIISSTTFVPLGSTTLAYDSGEHNTENEIEYSHRNSRERGAREISVLSKSSPTHHSVQREPAPRMSSRQMKRGGSFHTSDVASSAANNVGDARGNAPVVLLRTELVQITKGCTDSGRFRGNITSPSAGKSNG